MSSSYLHALQQFQIVREQRNSLFKRPHSKAELDPWNEKLIEFGSEVLYGRLQTLPRLSEAARIIHDELSKGVTLSLSYQATFPVSRENSPAEIKSAFERALHEASFLEAERRMTLVGPHRDDFKVFFDGVDARLFGSQGEQKTAALSLKLAEGKLFAEASEGEPPLYLLDDCFSELDPRRQEAVLKIIEPEAQSILTFASRPPQGFKPTSQLELSKKAPGSVNISEMVPGTFSESHA